MSTVLDDRIGLDDELFRRAAGTPPRVVRGDRRRVRDQVAIWYRGREMTYGELDRAAKPRWPGSSAARGVRRGDCVGAPVTPSPDIFVVGYWRSSRPGRLRAPRPGLFRGPLSFNLENSRRRAVVATTEAEISTASFLATDLLTMGDGASCADCVSLGSARVENGRLTVGEVNRGCHFGSGAGRFHPGPERAGTRISEGAKYLGVTRI